MKIVILIIATFFITNVAEAHHRQINRTTNLRHNASWYSTAGKRTASGMNYAYSIAHRTLPFGTKVRVTNVHNGRSVVAVVTDRGPFVKGRTLDVNKAVAKTLGFISNGLATLRMEILGR